MCLLSTDNRPFEISLHLERKKMLKINSDVPFIFICEMNESLWLQWIFVIKSQNQFAYSLDFFLDSNDKVLELKKWPFENSLQCSVLL